MRSGAFLKIISDGETDDYSSLFLISDRRRDGLTFADNKDPLYSVIADVILLSDNDRVSQADDDDYIRRAALFSSGNFYTVSYEYKERPNRKIATQINDMLLKAAADYSSKPESEDKVKEVLGIDNNKINTLEAELISSLDISEAMRAIRSIPMNVCDKYSFDEISGYLSDKNIIEKLAITEKNSEKISRKIKALLDLFADNISENLSPATISEMDVGIADKLDKGSLSTYSDIFEYYKSCLFSEIRTDFYQGLRQKISEIKQEAVKTGKELDIVCAEFKKVIPTDGYDDLKSLYEHTAQDYISSEIDKVGSSLKKILKSGNSKEDIYDALKINFDAVLEKNYDGVFSLRFTEEMTKRLQRNADYVYESVKDDLERKVADHVLLDINSSPEPELKVIMLHTFEDRDDNAKTELFSYLEEAFRGREDVQYINTGYDDELEVRHFNNQGGSWKRCFTGDESYM